MARRFTREGLYHKKRSHFQLSGIKDYAEEFKWNLTEWHYNYWMFPKAEKALLETQNKADHLRALLSGGGVCSPRSFYFRTFVPSVSPFVRSSDPFCSVSANRTGWKARRREIRPFPLVKDDRRKGVSGCDPSPAKHPVYR